MVTRDGGACHTGTWPPDTKGPTSSKSVSTSEPLAGKNYSFSFPSIMITTNDLHDLPRATSNVSCWGSVAQAIRGAARRFLDVSMTLACCCLQAEREDLSLVRVDQGVRDAIRERMRLHAGYARQDTCVGGAVRETLLQDGYNMSDTRTVEIDVGVKRTMREWDAFFERLGMNPLSTVVVPPPPSDGEAKIIPKFASACALHIRSKLGILANNEANVLLVQRKYLEICRKHRVRDVDTVLHQGFVMNAVFTEGVLDDVASSRRRLPAWIRFLEGVPETKIVSSAIC